MSIYLIISLSLVFLWIIYLLNRKWLKRKFQLWRIKSGIRECEETKIISGGKRQYLIRLSNGSLKVVDKSYVNIFNNVFAGKMRKMNFLDLLKMSLYHTK